MRRRRAFTLVEVVVFSAIGLLVVTGAWSLFRSSMTKGKRTDSKLQGVQAGLLFALQLEKDLDALHEARGKGIEFKITKEGADLLFHRYALESAGSTWEPLETRRVLYQFRTETGRIVRTLEGEPARELHGAFERVNFRPVKATPRAGYDGLLPEAPAIVFSAVAIPDEALARPPSERRGPDRTVVVGGVPRVTASRRNAYPFWNPVPYGPSR